MEYESLKVIVPNILGFLQQRHSKGMSLLYKFLETEEVCITNLFESDVVDKLIDFIFENEPVKHFILDASVSLNCANVDTAALAYAGMSNIMENIEALDGKVSEEEITYKLNDLKHYSPFTDVIYIILMFGGNYGTANTEQQQ